MPTHNWTPDDAPQGQAPTSLGWKGVSLFWLVTVLSELLRSSEPSLQSICSPSFLESCGWRRPLLHRQSYSGSCTSPASAGPDEPHPNSKAHLARPHVRSGDGAGVRGITHAKRRRSVGGRMWGEVVRDFSPRRRNPPYWPDAFTRPTESSSRVWRGLLQCKFGDWPEALKS